MVEPEFSYGPEPLKFLVLDLFTCDTPEFLKRRALEYTLLSWVTCARIVVNTTSVEEAVVGWKRYFNVSDKVMTKETATRTYYRVFEQWQKYQSAELAASKAAEKAGGGANK